MPAHVDLDWLAQHAFRSEILLVRGAAFSAENRVNRHVRFNVAFSQDQRLGSYLGERLPGLAAASLAIGRAASMPG